MCKCTPNKRTPYCGAPGCEEPEGWGERNDLRLQGEDMKRAIDDWHQNIYQFALHTFGGEQQILKAIEECGELVQALAKHALLPRNGEVRANVIEELADVQIMVKQMALYFGLEDFERQVTHKTSRLSLRIATELGGKENMGELPS